jgi:hypothetical protein
MNNNYNLNNNNNNKSEPFYSNLLCDGDMLMSVVNRFQYTVKLYFIWHKKQFNFMFQKCLLFLIIPGNIYQVNKCKQIHFMNVAIF